MKKVSATNTKTEILEVYEELLEELKSERENNTALKRELEKKTQIVATATKEIKSGTTQSILEIRNILTDQLDKVEKGINEEQRKIEAIQEAIKIEKDNLENLYKIKTEAESLEALVLTRKKIGEQLEIDFIKRKEELEAEIQKKKSIWEQEEEAYQYQLKIKRRNEEDTYQRKKEEREIEYNVSKKNIDEREKILKEKETELQNLQKQVDGFDKLISDAINKTKLEITDQLNKEFNFKQQLDNKDLEAKINLQKQEIESLNKKIAEQQDIIKSLSVQFDNASKQAKEIALKAIESTGIKNLNLPGFGAKEEK